METTITKQTTLIPVKAKTTAKAKTGIKPKASPKSLTRIVVKTSKVTSETISNKTVKAPVRTFRDLGTWRSARDLAVAIQRQCELFLQPGQAIAYQLSRATIGACSHIARGFNQWDFTDKEASYLSASSSLVEVENLLTVAKEMGYINAAQHDDLLRRCQNTYWMLVSLRKSSQEWAKNHAI